jgi:hypothetical protein
LWNHTSEQGQAFAYAQEQQLKKEGMFIWNHLGHHWLVAKNYQKSQKMLVLRYWRTLFKH